MFLMRTPRARSTQNRTAVLTRPVEPEICKQTLGWASPGPVFQRDFFRHTLTHRSAPEVGSRFASDLVYCDTVKKMIPLLRKALVCKIVHSVLQNHAQSIALEEYALKTCPDVQKVVLGAENGLYRDHREKRFFCFPEVAFA